ncbi:prefoldin subunit 2 [Biomphalaria glabrata]|nr:prefoldin subunit 2-like [Biomphalaria glabrata]KAI8756427.1 prefoldin subunit 2-like [Biomphalaria glabrata]KAI8797144.1 prefoldin subunit 2 [Biomphalaria glabrata]KAI8797818.1 prefoldin subunit 2 [Biomphalaria glabrata]KAK0042786.1 prefoldin subunit 2 [Biomphalaria pfeifferi]
MATSSATAKALSKEQIVAGFNELRQQQRMLASRISEIEMDMKEHDLVIEVLKGVDASRKCFRMIGGVLVERTVGVVLPGLISNREKMKEYTESIRSSLEAKGKELNQFRETHGIQFKADDSKEEKRSDSSQKPGDRQANILANV